MAEYIEREALEVDLNHRLNFLMAENGEYDSYTSGFDEAVSRVENFKSSSAEPVKHGHWTNAHWRNSTHCMECSVCGGEAQHREFRGVKKYYSICPHCGAKMDGGENE